MRTDVTHLLQIVQLQLKSDCEKRKKFGFSANILDFMKGFHPNGVYSFTNTPLLAF